MSAEVTLTEDEREMLEVSTALFGWATQREALEAVEKCVEHIVAAHVERERERIANTIEDELLVVSAEYMTPSQREGARWAARVARRA